VIPIRDENPNLFTPVVTVAIIALNVAAWVFVERLGSAGPLARAVCHFGLVPGELLHRVAPGPAVPLGPGFQCVIGPTSDWATLLTHMFMHGGWLHLIGNMWFLWIFGNNVEDSMGHVRFAVFFLLCGLAAAGLQIASKPDSAIPMVGASGAIGGVMGAYVLLYPRVRVEMLVVLGFYVTTVAVPAYLMLGYWFLLQLLGGASSLASETAGVAFWAHVGGFAAGMALIGLFRKPELVARHPYHGWSRSGRGWQARGGLR
jgi:membrane associated rhomboid family serine protease